MFYIEKTIFILDKKAFLSKKNDKKVLLKNKENFFI
jgi:hypothetical protein